MKAILALLSTLVWIALINVLTWRALTDMQGNVVRSHQAVDGGRPDAAQ